MTSPENHWLGFDVFVSFLPKLPTSASMKTLWSHLTNEMNYILNSRLDYTFFAWDKYRLYLLDALLAYFSTFPLVPSGGRRLLFLPRLNTYFVLKLSTLHHIFLMMVSPCGTCRYANIHLRGLCRENHRTILHFRWRDYNSRGFVNIWVSMEQECEGLAKHVQIYMCIYDGYR